MKEIGPSQSQRRDSHESLGSSDEGSRSPSSQNSPRSIDDDDEVSRDSLSEFSSIRLDGTEDSQDSRMVSSSVPNQCFLNNAANRKREANDGSLDPSTRKRTFSNAGTLQQGNGEKRTATKICRVCGDKAYSYNFNVITCESCKAFFRRNANKEKEIRCPFNENCDINIVSRRFCQRCRLQKCFKVGMKKEWIMSDEARLEKKQRIQDNRERRMAEKSQDERAELNNVVPAPMALGNLPSNVLPSAILPPQVMVLPPVPAAPEQLTQPSLAQTVLHAQQVQNAQILAAAAASAQADVNQQIAAAVAATRPPSLLVSNNMSEPMTNAVNQTNYNSTPQQIVQAHQNQIAQVQQAAQAVQALQQQVQIEHMQQQAVNQMVAHQQQAAAHQAAQQIVAHQQQQQQVQLAAAVAAAATAMGAGNPGSVMNPQTAADLVQQQAVAVLQAAATAPQTQLTPSVLNNGSVMNNAVINNSAVLNTPSVLNNQSTILPIPHPPLVNQMNGTPPSLPTINEAVVSPPVTTSNELIAVPKNLLIKLVEKNIEVNQASGNPPLKCNCRCQCGRYPNDILIVDKVMADLLESSSVESKSDELMETGNSNRDEIEYNNLDEEDRAVLNEILQSNLFWASDHSMESGTATDVALRRLIRMMGGLQTFRRLSKSDQTVILKHGCTSHFAIRSAMTMNDNSLQQNTLISNTVIQFYNSLREEWRTNESIMLLLSVIVMFDPDTPELENRALVQLQNSKCTRALRRILFTVCGSNREQCKAEFNGINKNISILKCLNDVSLSQASTANGNISVCSWSDEVVEPLLYKELYEPNQSMDINVH
ncbi:unnamed protein product [Bursaphelenchus xylophilus]|uniref:(pine wood nematode) hypothetical protein n=1 Tax=Bursaphelenchus xylophilus TaxID=6326 RepID=A0A1I7SMN4_BURXY|nr:unnamed protein product [Bursaphelenchus xylophilus]CAG9130296.1 unnamed protein product [Bursaphelenchus xylophilus]